MDSSYLGDDNGRRLTLSEIAGNSRNISPAVFGAAGAIGQEPAGWNEKERRLKAVIDQLKIKRSDRRKR